MLISKDRRIVLLHLALMGMDVAWVTPLFLWLYPAVGLSYWFLLWGWAAVWTLVLDVVDFFSKQPVAVVHPTARRATPVSRMASARYIWMVLGLFILSTLVITQGQLYAHIAWYDGAWVAAMLGNLSNFDAGLQPEAVLLLTNAVLWLRASWATNRNLTALAVANTVKGEFFLLLVTSGLWHAISRLPVPFGFFWLYFALALVVLTLTRVMERAARSKTAGRALPVDRLLQLLGVTGGFVWVAGGVSDYLPAPINIVLGWVPVVLEMAFMTIQILFVLVLVLAAQLGQWLAQLLNLGAGASEGADIVGQPQLLTDLVRQFAESEPTDVTVAPWLLTLLRFLPLILLLGVTGLVFVLVARRLRGRFTHVEKDEEADTALGVGDWLHRSMDQLRDLAGLVQRFGVSGQLLAAISVQNIYANLCRIAAREGAPRHRSMPPDDYLPVLIEVFGGFSEALARITDAYMRVHYGEHPITPRELARLQVDYREIRRRKESGSSRG